MENNRTLPYGEAWLAENTPSTNDKKFTTYQRDSESGLDYAMERQYVFSNGRFLSPDKASPPLFIPAGLNRYVYVLNDPINLTDQTGRECRTTWDGNRVNVVCNVTAPLPSMGGGGAGGRGGRSTAQQKFLDYEDMRGRAPDQVLAQLEAIGVEGCSLGIRLRIECEEDEEVLAAAAVLRGGIPGVIGGIGMAAVRIMGILGESKVGSLLNLEKNKDFIIRATQSGTARIPDFVDQFSKTIYEVKNASYVSLSQQLADMIAWSVQNGWNFTLYVSGNVSGPLQDLAKTGIINIVKF
jgi:RHS repeat-associated protein